MEARALTPKDEMRGKIQALEAAILAQPERLIEFPLKHYFAPGLYLREMTMPKGAVLTGKIHKTEHYCILAQGEVSVGTEEGMKRLKAPAVVHSMPGTKRALYAHDEAVWVNVHHNPTNEQDLERIESLYTVPTYQAFSDFLEQGKLEKREG